MATEGDSFWMLLVCSKLTFCSLIYYQKSPLKKTTTKKTPTTTKNVASGGESRSPIVSFLTRTSWKMKASPTQTILCLPIHFLAPKGKKKSKPSCFLSSRPNMAKHQGNSEWNQLHLLLTEFSFILILPRAGYSAASNYNEELLSNGFQIAPWWGINWKGQFKSLGHVNAFLILSDWEISGCKRLKCSELIKT